MLVINNTIIRFPGPIVIVSDDVEPSKTILDIRVNKEICYYENFSGSL